MDRSYVTRKDQESPIGYILESNNGSTTVRWGVQDGRAYDEVIETSQLSPVEYDIHSPEEIQIRQAKESGARFKFEGENNG